MDIEILNLGRVVGFSAYELAVQQGFEGTLNEWLESLKYVSSDEYKQLVAQVEEAKKQIESTLTSVNLKTEELVNLVTQSLTDIATSKTQALSDIKTLHDSAIRNISSAETTATDNISSALVAALNELSIALSTAKTGISESGSTWKKHIEDSGVLATDSVNDAKTQALEEITAAKDTSSIELAKNQAIEEINKAKDVTAIETAKTEAVKAVKAAETAANESINTQKTTSIEEIKTEGNTQVEIIKSTMESELSKKLDKNLGTNNGNKVLTTDAEGNITTQSKEDFEGGGTSDYNDLENKPQINGVELSGNKSGNNVGLVDAQQGIENSGKVLGIGQDGLVIPVENAGASDNIIYKDVPKQLNPNVIDSFQRAMWNLKLYGQSTQVTTTGAQLFDKNSVVTGLLNGNGSIIQNTGYSTSDYIEVVEGQNYYCTKTGSVRGKYYNSNKEPIQTTSYEDFSFYNDTYITIPVGVSYIRFSLSNSNNETIMLNTGTTPLPYEPYTSGKPSPSPEYKQDITAISQFSGQVNNGSEQSQPFSYTPTNPMYSTQDGSIADYVDVEKGVEVYNMGTIVYDGSNDEWWSAYPLKKGFTIQLAKLKSGTAVKGWCDKFVVKDNITYETGIILGLDNNYLYIAGVNDIIPTVEELRTWLSQNPITVVYPLVFPTETPIPQEQLQMLRSLYTYTGVTNFLCNAPVSFTYERSLQIVINNLENEIRQTNANILLGGTL